MVAALQAVSLQSALIKRSSPAECTIHSSGVSQLITTVVCQDLQDSTRGLLLPHWGVSSVPCQAIQLLPFCQVLCYSVRCIAVSLICSETHNRMQLTGMPDTHLSIWGATYITYMVSDLFKYPQSSRRHYPDHTDAGRLQSRHKADRPPLKDNTMQPTCEDMHYPDSSKLPQKSSTAPTPCP